MGKAGFDEDALIEISRVEHDNLGVAPATPPSGQVATYAKSSRFYQKLDTGAERAIGPQTAAEVDVDTSTGANTLLGTYVQDILNKYYGPTNSEKPTYLGSGEVDYVEYFNSSSQVTGNRIAKVTFSYDGNLDPTTETWLFYDTNGTTVLKTVTLTHSFTSSNHTSSIQVTS